MSEQVGYCDPYPGAMPQANRNYEETGQAYMTLTPIELLLSEAPARRATIALGEGSDPRIVAGARDAVAQGIADIILVGDRDAVAAQLGTDVPAGITVHDPAHSPLNGALAESFHRLRAHKGVDAAKAAAALRDPLVYAAMLVREGHADGTVSGAVATTPDVVRTALQVIGKAADAALVSSCFLMLPPKDIPDGAFDGARAMIFSDCGLIIDPDAAALAEIAAASARSCRALLRTEPRIAMLSFSTKGSARHAAVTRVSEATSRLRAAHPDLAVDGEMQFDAAFVASVGASKAPGSAVAGQANVMVFPNLDAGNIGYKIAQRLGGYAAIGPILQGLARPANDLSRGCVAGDVTQMIAVTALQSMS